MRTEPQPLSTTARGGNRIANNTLKKDILYLFYITTYNPKQEALQESVLQPQELLRSSIFC